MEYFIFKREGKKMVFIGFMHISIRGAQMLEPLTGPCFVRSQKDCYEVNNFERIHWKRRKKGETKQEKKNNAEIKDEMFGDKCKFK